MPTSQSTADHILDLIAGAGDVSARKMFGEYGVYCDGKFAALVCDDTFFIKMTEAGRAFAPELEAGEPYPGAKSALVVGEDLMEDSDRLCELLRVTTAALPAPKPKPPRKRKS